MRRTKSAGSRNPRAIKSDHELNQSSQPREWAKYDAIRHRCPFDRLAPAVEVFC